MSVFHSCDMQDIADKHPPQLPAMFVALAPLLHPLSILPLLLREEIPPAGMVKLPSPKDGPVSVPMNPQSNAEMCEEFLISCF